MPKKKPSKPSKTLPTLSLAECLKGLTKVTIPKMVNMVVSSYEGITGRFAECAKSPEGYTCLLWQTAIGKGEVESLEWQLTDKDGKKSIADSGAAIFRDVRGNVTTPQLNAYRAHVKRVATLRAIQEKVSLPVRNTKPRTTGSQKGSPERLTPGLHYKEVSKKAVAFTPTPEHFRALFDAWNHAGVMQFLAWYRPIAEKAPDEIKAEVRAAVRAGVGK